jgi:DNA topoisomerase-2
MSQSFTIRNYGLFRSSRTQSLINLTAQGWYLGSGTMTSVYKKLTQREHILQLPDTYIGSRDSHREGRWVYDDETKKMGWKEVSFNPGLFKLFDELAVNALDHVTRQAASPEKSKRVTQVAFTLTPTGFSVHNDGEGIPITVHPEYKVMIPELIFGHLLTSSNYDEAEEKTVGGKNGYGAKLTNIYSKEFTVRTCDGKILFEQVFSDNMAVVGKPTMKKVETKSKSFTEIRSVPDLARFYGPEGSKEIPEDMLAVLRTRVVDAAALAAANGCRVALNGSLVPVGSFEQYVRLFTEEEVPIFYERCGPRWEIAAALTRHLHTSDAGVSDDRHISFVNGIFTRRGGKHVDAVSRAVLGTFCEGPGKKLDLKPAQLKDAVTFFVNATIVNPSFDSQTKETLTTPVAKFGSTFKISDAFVNKLAKEGGLLDEAQAVLDAKLSREAKKSDGKRTVTVRGIPKLEDATWAGGPKSGECTLILTEGDSAASTAIAGLKVVGRERYGVFPLKGKILNVKDATMEKKTKNDELTRIKRILGLEHGKTYNDVKKLRYGRVMIMTDQDVDGSHIKGLLINLFHTEWPQLLRLNFLCCLMTPLLKATKGSQVRSFFSASEYEKFIETAEGKQSGWSVKYYKGLGTSTSAEARDYFTTMNTVRFQWDDVADINIDLAFNKKRADDRKEWLATYDRDRVIDVPAGGADVSYTRFVNDELIHFSNADNLRSLPHMMDGLKPSQRKILWAARKRNLVSEIKVAQLAGYVSETAAYHHGEVSLTGAIVGMAQNFVGSNNINLLAPNGQFGTRLQGGADSASPRYIFTALERIQATLLQKADDPALSWLEDDGQVVEPEYYMPVLPLLLVNGSVGIGTGFSTEVLPHNPADLVSALRNRLRGETADLSELKLGPWWDGFRGPVTMTADGKKVFTRGIYQFLDDDTHRVRITELPVGVWTKDYKAYLDELVTGTSDPKASDAASAARVLKGFQEAYNDVDVEFVLTLDADYYHEARTWPAEFEKKFRLVNSTSMTNMVAFDCDGHIRRFASAGSILETFYVKRLGGYVSRKANELARLDAEIQELDARTRFVKAVVTGTLVVANADDKDLFADMKELGLPLLSAPDSGDLRGYEYLLRMRVDRLKAKAVLELEEELASVRGLRDSLAAKSAEDLWLADLDVFSEAYTTFAAARVAARNQVGPVATKKSAKGSKKV